MAVFLVSGADGFIGSHLAERLLQEGALVRVLDNLSARGGANLDYLKRIKTGRLEIITDDIRHPKACRMAAQGADYVLHQAALGSVPRSVEDPATTHEVNATGTLNLLLAAKEARVKRFVWASSSSIYGAPEPAEAAKDETLCPCPLSPYGASKVMGEHYARLFFELYGLPTVSLRYFNVFGPRQDPQGPYAAVIPRFIQLMLEGKRPIIFGDGRQSRDFTYISDVVAGNLLALKAPGAAGQAINLASGESHTLLDLAACLNRLLDLNLEPEFEPARPGDIRHSLADVSLAERLLGFRPQVSFEEGLALTIASFRQG